MMGGGSIGDALCAARLEFHDRVEATLGSDAYLRYVRENHLPTHTLAPHVGAFGVIRIVQYINRRFDFADDGDLGFVMEAYGADGETIVDLIAWRLSHSDLPMTLFGRCGLLGLWQAMAPGTYFMGGTLRLHRTPLLWMQSGCDGAAIVDEHVAGRQLMEVPGRIAAEDRVHAREISRLLRTAADIDNKVIAPIPSRRAA
jgi:hypothetical protein